jgi:hypothetical protein
VTSYPRDTGLDALLTLDGQVLVVDPEGEHWVKFVVKRVPPSAERPHGLSYSLTLHDADGNRIVGFDNAHAVRADRPSRGSKRIEHDHRHVEQRVRPYDYSDAGTLLADFWEAVDSVLKAKGVLP